MNDTDLVKQKIDIVDFIKEYTTLMPSGSNFKARCPFHQEKTPSFMVSPTRQSWHCFGCGEGGDVIKFLEKVENLNFIDALRKLADRAGVELSSSSRLKGGTMAKLFDAMKLTTEFWQQQLNSHNGKTAWQYLLNRGISSETIKEFDLGWAPEGWDNLAKYLLKNNYTLRELQQIGLISLSNDGRGVDRFRERIMFPIRDIHGSVVGFGGRIIVEKENAPKYLNSPQSILYNKSEVLYRLNASRSEIKRLNYVILVEGYMDAIGVWQSGTKNVVAVCGTALTPQQVQLIKRYTNNVMIAFDADLAGQKANLRGIDLLWQAGMNVKVIVMPTGKDPDELARHDPQAWRQSIKEAREYVDYIASLIFAQHDLSKLEQKKEAAKKIVNLLVYLNDPVERDHYVRAYASKLGTNEATLNELIIRSAQQQKVSNQTEISSEQKISPELPQSIRTAENLLAILLNEKKFNLERIKFLEPRWLPAGDHRDLYEYVKTLYTHNGSKTASDLNSVIPEHLSVIKENCQLLFETDYKDLSIDALQQEAVRLASFLISSAVRQRKLEIINLLQSAETSGNQEEITSLVAESIELDQLIAQINNVAN